GARESGTYFIGYTARLWVIEQMLERMFVGVPPGAYDRLLDFSTAVTSTHFFVPTAGMLEELAEPSAAAAEADASGTSSPAPTSTLGIASRRGEEWQPRAAAVRA